MKGPAFQTQPRGSSCIEETSGSHPVAAAEAMFRTILAAALEVATEDETSKPRSGKELLARRKRPLANGHLVVWQRGHLVGEALCGTVEGAPACMAPGPMLTFCITMAPTTALRLEGRACGNSAPCTGMTTIRMNLSGHKCELSTPSAGGLPHRNQAHPAFASNSPNLALITVPSLHRHCLFCS